jgi:hypothetical protein
LPRLPADRGYHNVAAGYLRQAATADAADVDGEFLREKIAEMGDQVPWKREFNRRVLLDSHAEAKNGIFAAKTRT